MAKPQQLLFLELNELNFGAIEAYVAKGELPTFARLIAQGYTRTTSETEYQDLEPWIQWVTAHTGLSLAEHRVFRLGDIVDHDIPQIWEQLEAKGLSVGAISPMNAKYRLNTPAFFIPDPWTQTDARASGIDRRMYAAVREAINENASGRFSARSALDFAIGGLLNASPASYSKYLAMVAGVRSKPWNKALFLDLLLGDMFVKLVRQSRPDFASLFLNAGAHIQHHYMFNSAVYEGDFRNPDWYLRADADPVLDVYRLYDSVIARVMGAFPDARVMIATGLHQVPYGRVSFYWRLKEHAAFLDKIGVPYRSVAPRMSRDFLVTCDDAVVAATAERRLLAARTQGGQPLFEVDNRGDDLFVTLVHPEDIPADFVYFVGNERFEGLRDDVAFVAIKNGEHDGTGYFLDTGRKEPEDSFPLRDIPDRIKEAMLV